MPWPLGSSLGRLARTMTRPFALTLFSTRPGFIQDAVACGCQEIIVDWENQGKKARQSGADTQINHDTLEDLQRVRGCTRALVLCRINSFGPGTATEVEQAIAAGADEILVPMVRSAAEVRTVLGWCKGRCGVGILVETMEAIRELAALADLPLSRVYVGLNDLAIARRSPSIFLPVVDGLLERLRAAFRVPFGFGGLTLPENGHPIPCRLLMAEMARLDCQFSFLRRSFHRDVEGLALSSHMPRILEAFALARRRGPAEVARDHRDLEIAIRQSLGPQAQATGYAG
jgi:hypothetical protein